MGAKKKFKWVVEITVDKTWVEDGFNLSNERAKEIMQKVLPYSYSSEINAKVLKAPPIEEILKVQGYEGVKLEEEKRKFKKENKQ